MTELNKDGLEIGKPVSFEEMRKVQLRNKSAVNLDAPKFDIPTDWQNMSVPAKRELAQKLSNQTVIHSVEKMDEIIANAVAKKELEDKKGNAPKEVKIPDDWDELPFMTQRGIAWDIAGNNEAKNGKDVDRVIQAEIERRKA